MVVRVSFPLRASSTGYVVLGGEVQVGGRKVGVSEFSGRKECNGKGGEGRGEGREEGRGEGRGEGECSQVFLLSFPIQREKLSNCLPSNANLLIHFSPSSPSPLFSSPLSREKVLSLPVKLSFSYCSKTFMEEPSLDSFLLFRSDTNERVKEAQLLNPSTPLLASLSLSSLSSLKPSLSLSSLFLVDSSSLKRLDLTSFALKKLLQIHDNPSLLTLQAEFTFALQTSPNLFSPFFSSPSSPNPKSFYLEATLLSSTHSTPPLSSSSLKYTNKRESVEEEEEQVSKREDGTPKTEKLVAKSSHFYVLPPQQQEDKQASSLPLHQEEEEEKTVSSPSENNNSNQDSLLASLFHQKTFVYLAVALGAALIISLTVLASLLVLLYRKYSNN